MQDTARDWTEPKRCVRLSEAPKRTTRHDRVADRQPAMIGLGVRTGHHVLEEERKADELYTVEILAKHISKEIGDEFERHLDGRGPDRRSTRHLWCVILATICRLYDQAIAFAKHSIDHLVHEVINMLREDVSTDRGEETRARDGYQYRHRILAAFDLVDYAFLEALIKRAIASIAAAMKAIDDGAMMKHLRLIGAIICPDPDRHPGIVRYCVWPLLMGPFRGVLGESVATEMRMWLRNAYVTVPKA